ncbi:MULTISPECIES: hypothetical protein [unclassified Streptomyces]|uniref:hypothetical protein n=1 Tax=unclassified Streptomyces TaxID=2593676 RepID=UPI001BE7C7B1|nr:MULTISPECIES: hypothetical protein [unclassified Streptomyces]MBT2380323.1 hypothetical protein [Streptomyces sp. ISL-111]MBT2428628.1 hypothetical protein [Streptomyces sp. ISL-112]MBT2464029.1 hypothetical protein [Streptomyces sp. ISL-63]
MLHIGMETGSRTTATNPTTTTTPTTDPAPAPVAADQPCDLVTVPARQGLEAVDILRRGRDHEAVGPVLHNGVCDTLGFLVPPGTADAWDVPGSACTRTDGRGLRLPTTPPAAGSGWLLPPAEDAPVTDPAALRAALDQAARLLEAADGCR